MAYKSITFSDIDGTLVHYLDEPGQLQEIVGEIIQLPQSSTGRLGIISQATLQKAAQLRQQGSALVLVSGARTSTVLQRLPFLPAADAIVAENDLLSSNPLLQVTAGRLLRSLVQVGVAIADLRNMAEDDIPCITNSTGIKRIWYPDPDGHAACPLREDSEWRQQLSNVTGAVDQDVLPPLERKGPLWDWYRQLHGDGWKLDANSYCTAFRLKDSPGKSQADMQAIINSRPSCLGCSFNLGVADFYPAASGKEGVAAYLMKRFGVPAERTAFLCDDDNDLQLAAMVGKAFLPGISAASVEAAIAANPDRFVVANVKWTAGTEQMLDAVQQHLQQLEQEGKQLSSSQQQQAMQPAVAEVQSS